MLATSPVWATAGVMADIIKLGDFSAPLREELVKGPSLTGESAAMQEE